MIVVIDNIFRFATAIFSLFYTMANTALIKDMLDHAVHIGHKRQFWSAKMRDYIYGIQNNIHVFDLYKTEVRITEVKKALEEANSKGKVVLIVGTKLQARDIVRTTAEETGNYYINTKWVPGLLTNFPTIKKRIAAYNQIEKDLETGALEMLTKKEKASKLKELDKLRKAYEGIKDIKKTPDLLIVVDGHYESLALEEARTLSIPTYALLGSTGDIDHCSDFIPCNVNSIKSIKFVLDYLKTAIKRAKKTEGGVMGRTEKLAPKTPVTAE
jgi:small subunit ribosomal protein S2